MPTPPPQGGKAAIYAQETLQPHTAPPELGSSNAVPGETESRCTSDSLHGRELTAQPENTNSSGSLLRGEEELRAFSCAYPPAAPREKQQHLLPHPRGGEPPAPRVQRQLRNAAS